jgi:hypothetical protein
MASPEPAVGVCTPAGTRPGRGGEAVTRFSVRLPRRHLRDPHVGYGICHSDAVAALYRAWQVTVIDPVWGRDDVLWPALEQAVQTAGIP